MCDSFGKNCQRFSGIFGNEYIGGGYLSQIGLLFFVLLFNQNKKKNYFILVKEIFFFSSFIFNHRYKRRKKCFINIFIEYFFL